MFYPTPRVTCYSGLQLTFPPFVMLVPHHTRVVAIQDDSPTNRKLLVRLLKLANNRCFEAANGLEAFAMVKRSLIVRDATHGAISPRLAEVYDVILMDNNMPKMSGIEATRELRKVGFVGPIIGISGDTSDNEFLRAGADALLTKPVSGAAVTKAIEEALRRRIRVAAEGENSVRSNQVPPPALFARGSFRQSVGNLTQTVLARTRGSRPPGMESSSSRIAPEPRAAVSPSYPRGAPRRVDSSVAVDVAYRPNRSPSRPGSVHIAPPQAPIRRNSHGGRSSVGRNSVGRNSVGDRGSEVLYLPNRGPSRAGSAAHISPGSVTERFPAARDSTAFVTDDAVMLKWEDVVSYTLNFIPTNFQTAEMRWAYAEYNRSNLNHKMLVVLVGPVAFAFIVTRGSFGTLWHLNPAFITAFVSYVMLCLCCLVVWANRLAVISYRHNITCMQRFHDPAARFYRSSYRDVFDNAVIVFTALCTSLYVLARVLQGVCPRGTTVWNEQECNPEGAEGEVPQDALLIAIITLIAVQVFIGCASRHSVAMGWIILLVLVNISMKIVGSSLFFWNNAVLVIAMCVSYETERWVQNDFAAVHSSLSD